MGQSGCAGGACLNPMCKASTAAGYPMAVDATPSIGFEGGNAAYIPNDVVIPTLDDVPDGADNSPQPSYAPGNWTKTDLAYLDSVNLHFDFFMNGDNWDGPIVGDSAQDDPDAFNDIVDIIKKHNVGNHTIYHAFLGTPSGDGVPNGGSACIPSCCDCGPPTNPCSMSQCTAGTCNSNCYNIPDTCESEVQGIEALVNKISNGGIPHPTRFRPPYGSGYPNTGTAVPAVMAMVAKYAVAVGWEIDSQDADQSPGGANATPTFVVNNVTSALGTGPGKGTAWGIVLTHGVLPWTAPALKTLYDPQTGYMKAHGFRLGTVEDAICWKYGKHSWEIVNEVNHYTGCDVRGPN
jgi:peptidoglycan/xylan/chitin deacetylase (PgdA/CDA1 family)